MPYTIRKQKCKQSDGDSGSYVLSYTSKKGKKYNNCHTSKKGAQDQIAAIEGPREMAEEFRQLLKKEIMDVLQEFVVPPVNAFDLGSDDGGMSTSGLSVDEEEIFEEVEVRKEDYGCFVEYLQRMDEANCGCELQEAEYQGRKVKLNKPMQGDVKKFKVYVKNEKGNVIKVNFGQGGKAKGGTMRIRKNIPKARKSFRARHNCDNPGPKHKARYWSCRKW